MPNRRHARAPRASDAPSPEGLRDLLTHLLAGVAGGSEAKWRKLIGEVERVPIVLIPRSNWRVDLSGTPVERDAIDKAIEVVRGAHPYVSAQMSDKP